MQRIERIVLRHLGGSKANQVDEFPLSHFKELSFGRDSSLEVKYDSRDSVVSLRHAKIRQDPLDSTRFTISALDGQSDTYLNKDRVRGVVQITAGDVVQLGAGGPEFQFDLEPRPQPRPEYRMPDIEPKGVDRDLRMLRAFLCHSSDDKILVRELHKQLRDDKIDPWLDEENLLPGQMWDSEITKAVRASDVVIVCLSSRSVSKAGYVQKEIKYALDVADEQPEGTIFIIPVKLEECRIPDRLAHLHCVKLFEGNGYERLLRALRSRESKLG
jgi:hypothetical protein